MNRWLLIGSLAALLLGSTGCFQPNLRKNCSTNGNCNQGYNLAYQQGNPSCGGNCGGNCNNGCEAGMMERFAGLWGFGGDKAACRTGCRAGRLGWQQGGLDYSSYLHPGPLGHNAAHNLNNRAATPGPPTGQVAYPYYTVRGPRDFLAENPPTIGR